MLLASRDGMRRDCGAQGGPAQEPGLLPGDGVSSANGQPQPDGTLNLHVQVQRDATAPFELDLIGTVPPIGVVLARQVTQDALADAARQIALLEPESCLPYAR